MDEQNFLQFGWYLNNADESRRLNRLKLVNMGLDGLIAEMKALPPDEDRIYLLEAADRKRQGRFVVYPHEWKEHLLPIARMWCGLNQQESYKDVLEGVTQLNPLKEGHSKIQNFHSALIDFAGTDDRHELIMALLRVQEATSQFLVGQEGKVRPMTKWTTLSSLITIWKIPDLPEHGPVVRCADMVK